MKRRVKALTVVLAICLITVFIRCQSNETPIQQLVVVVNGDSIEMVFVKGGTFMMGCTDEQGCDCEDNEKPARKESVSDFYIGKYEVTQRLWRAVMDTDSILSARGIPNIPSHLTYLIAATVFIVLTFVSTTRCVFPFGLSRKTKCFTGHSI